MQPNDRTLIVALVNLVLDDLLRLVAQRLSEQEYRIVYLRYWEELSMREIVMTVVHRAKVQVRLALTEDQLKDLAEGQDGTISLKWKPDFKFDARVRSAHKSQSWPQQVSHSTTASN